MLSTRLCFLEPRRETDIQTFLGPENFFFLLYLYGTNFMRGIDYAHFLSIKKIILILIQRMELVYGRKKKIFQFSYTESIPRIHAQKMCAIDSPHKITPDGCFPDENRNFFYFRVNTLNPFPESGTRKPFHTSGVRAIDFSHKITPYTC